MEPGPPHHREVPGAVLIIGAGAGGRRRGLLLGQFAASRWQLASGGVAAVGEVFVSGEGLVRGATGVLETLLHEAVHALAFAREVKDVSRQGRYHNARFRDLARELGLDVEHHPKLGWSQTSLPDATVGAYRQAIGVLDAALTAYREGEQPRRSDPLRGSAGVRVRLRATDSRRTERARASADRVRSLRRTV